LIQHLILGLIQGITEFLPVSSSGHLVIAKFLLGVESPGPGLEIVLHLATVIAVVIVLWKEFKKLSDIKYAAMVALGLVPAAVVGVVFSDQLDAAFGNPLPVGLFFLLTAGVLLSTKWTKPGHKPMTWWRALIIGLAQVFSLLPGISRSGITISAALMLGLEPEEAFRFSFFMLIPAVVGGALLKAKDISHLGHPGFIAVGFVASLAAGVASLFFLRKTVVSRKFFWFSAYLVIAGAASLAWFLWIRR